MRFKKGDATVGDVGVQMIATADVSLTGKTIYFDIVKPNGETIIRSATPSGYTATYTTVSGDLDVDGEYIILARDATTGYYFNQESGNIFVVRPKPDAIAKG